MLEPYDQKAKKCKIYVLNPVEDTVWMKATAYNRCNPDPGVSRRYWFVCSFYGIDDNPTTGSFDVLPNPNNGQMTLSFENLSGRVNMKVYDMHGNLIDDFDAEGANTMPYNMSHHANGVYFFVATCKDGVVSKKVIISQ